MPFEFGKELPEHVEALPHEPDATIIEPDTTKSPWLRIVNPLGIFQVAPPSTVTLEN
jgi:hypothetical protein